jgi:hypothetical protein
LKAGKGAPSALVFVQDLDDYDDFFDFISFLKYACLFCESIYINDKDIDQKKL